MHAATRASIRPFERCAKGRCKAITFLISRSHDAAIPFAPQFGRQKKPP